MPRIGKFPFFCKRYFRQIRKRIGRCRADLFWGAVGAIASMHGRRSLSRMARLLRYVRQSIAYFLEKAHVQAPELLRLKAVDTLRDLKYRAGDPIYILLDDTQKRKRGKLMQAVSSIFLHAEKIFAQGHTIVAAVLVYRNVLIPCGVRLWASEKACAESQRQQNPADRLTFGKLTDLASDLLAEAPLPDQANAIALFDSYYLCPALLAACAGRKMPFISVVKKNRNFAPDGRPRDQRKVGKYGRNVLRRQGRWHSVSGKRHRLAERVGQLSKVGRVKLVFSQRPHELAWVALVTNRVDWTSLTVLRHYFQRWPIEVFFKMSKQYLGLGDYQMLRYRGVVCYLHLVLIAYLLLTHSALTESSVKAEINEGKNKLRLPSIPQLQEQMRHQLWEDLISRMEKRPTLRRAARKLKKELVL